MLSNNKKNLASERLSKYLLEHFGVQIQSASNQQLYYALAYVAKQFLYEAKADDLKEQAVKPKTLHYMSIEFLLGRNLKNHLWNLGLENHFSELLKNNGKDISLVYDEEKDTGLGNGGLGRLASCFFESLAKLGYSAVGHCIRYEYGLFNQKIIDGKQVEVPDEWLDTGSVWLEPREDLAVEVLFGGTLEQKYNDGKFEYINKNATIVRALPYDMMVSGYGDNAPSVLRLWSAQAKNKFNIARFSSGEFSEAFREKNEIEAINKVLYPADETEKGRNLRLTQQYFLVSSAMQNILADYFKENKGLSKLANQVAVHINDTHPALCIPELMRLLMDKYGFGWDESWNAVCKVVSYTNHTILSEALEIKSMQTIEKIMPRIAMILREIDRRFRVKLAEVFGNDFRKIEQMAIISGNNVYMANLACVCSHAINGVSKIHSQIIKTRLFNAYAEMFPDRFKNITNGISYTRWVSESNPELDKLIVKLIGSGYHKDASELKKLLEFSEDKKVLDMIGKIKYDNKVKFTKYLKEKQGIEIDPNARFDVQVKRIHEYKRQLMNAMKIIYLCNQIRENPEAYVTPQVFIFSGKAASGYKLAKRIIKLINQISVEINNDPVLSSKIKVVFVSNYNVTLSEILMPATEVTEQISLAGREASGTGNMKAVANGALMLCTVDGANIEIADHVGSDNAFEFGLLAEDVEKIKSRGYNAMEYYISSERVRSVIDKMNSGLGGESFSDLADYLLGQADYKDSYMCLADFDSYIDAHYKMDRAYADKDWWNKKSLQCIASMGYFSADRCIEDYVSKIWKLNKPANM